MSQLPARLPATAILPFLSRTGPESWMMPGGAEIVSTWTSSNFSDKRKPPFESSGKIMIQGRWPLRVTATRPCPGSQRCFVSVDTTDPFEYLYIFGLDDLYNYTNIDNDFQLLNSIQGIILQYFVLPKRLGGAGDMLLGTSYHIITVPRMNKNYWFFFRAHMKYI